MTDLTGEITSSVIVLVLYGAIFAAAELAHRRLHLDAEITRKITHVCGGILALFLPHFFESHWTVLILGILFFLVLFITKRTRLVQSVHDVDRSTNGEIYFPLALALTYLVASITDTFAIYPVAILALTLGDTAAWLTGKLRGKYRYQIFGDWKSVEGSIAMGLTGTAIVIVFLFINYPDTAAQMLIIGPLAGTLGAVLEAISPRGTDNLTIPLGIWLLLWSIVPG